jgi:hypothetical protein
MDTNRPLEPAYSNDELNPSPTTTDPPAQSIHVLDSPNPNNCEVCGSNFLTADELEHHKSHHNPNKIGKVNEVVIL